MPANLSPEYKKAEADYRAARDPQARLECLQVMLRTIPKHKGTEHLQADLKTRIKELGDELAGPRRGGARTGPALVVRPEGAAQWALVGPPNTGKSSLHARLTGSHAVVGPYPFSTHVPLPGMLAHEDVSLQIVDLPPISADVMEPWLPNALQTADGALLVLDLGEPACLDQALAVLQRLDEKKVSLAAGASEPESPASETAVEPPAPESEPALEDPFRRRLPTLLLANKADRLAEPAAELAAFLELSGLDFPALATSAETGLGLAKIAPLLIERLGILRIYTKLPGHPADHARPFTLRRGATVHDVALLVHRGRAGELRFARIWGPSVPFEGQQVSATHPVADADVVELHW